MKIRFKKTRPDALDLRHGSSNAAGFDIATPEDVVIQPDEPQLLHTGLAFEIPIGYEGQLRPRSSLFPCHGLVLTNSPGTIDADYRGEVKIPVVRHGNGPITIKAGTYLAQLVISPVETPTFELTEHLSVTPRGSDGFGSTETSDRLVVRSNGFKKADGGKERLSDLADVLVRLKSNAINLADLGELLDVLDMGAAKYGPDNWKNCPNPTDYLDAIYRHSLAVMSGNPVDDESGKHHSAHILANALFFHILNNGARDETAE